MKKRIQRLVLSCLFVLSVGTIGVIIAEVSVGTAYAPKCPQCDDRRGCAGSLCTCPPVATMCTPPVQ